MTGSTSCIPLSIHKTSRFTVLGLANESHPSRKPALELLSPPAVEKQSKVPPYSNKKTIYLDINESYTRQVIQQAFAHPGRRYFFSVQLGTGDGIDAVPMPSNCDFQWAEYERIDWACVLKGQHGASSYCVRKGLSRKAQLAYYTRRYTSKNPQSILKSALPPTIIIDTWPVWEEDQSVQAGSLADVLCSVGGAGANNNNSDSTNQRKILEKCLAEAKLAMEQAELAFQQATGPSDPPMWILKPSTINKGAGIQILHIFEQLVDICWSESDIREWVLQRYIASPLLIKKKKFHIRAYALAVSALRVYLCHDCLALSSGTRYRKHETSNLHAHLTNTAFQELDPNFHEENCVFSWNDDSMASILVKDRTCKDIQEAQGKIQHVVKEMEAITAELFRAYENEFSVFAPIENCFEHYGLDFMVDDEWRVYLLEVNPGPDFKQTGAKLSKMIARLMGDTIDAALHYGECSDSPSQIGSLALVHENTMRWQSSSGVRLLEE